MASSTDKPDELTNDNGSTNVSQEQPSFGLGTLDGSQLVSRPLKRSSTTPLPSTSPSITTSPKPSREPSPVRPPLKPGTAGPSRPTRSRKNSQDLSPQRPANVSNANISTVPSAAAVQRALSATGSTQFPPPLNQEPQADTPRPQKSTRGPASAGRPVGITPPRIRSPPPSNPTNRPSVYSPRKPEVPPLTPSIIVERPSPVSTAGFEGDTTEGDNMARSGLRTPIRGTSGSSTLETVQESSLPAIPTTSASHLHDGGKSGQNERPSTINETSVEDAITLVHKPSMESGSESGGNRSVGHKKSSKDLRKPSNVTVQAKPLTIITKKSLTQLNPTKIKIAGEGTAKNMTVETETVSSVPQVAVGGGSGERGISGKPDVGGSVRLKPSTETIRPKKEKKRTTRKAPSINAGTGGFPRRFHHHHPYSRAASPEVQFPDSLISPDSVVEYRPEPFSSVPRLEQHAPSSMHIHPRDVRHYSQPQIPQSTISSVVLTTFRGRIASSKADIFEAKVASAVDEVNSSDSEETFVYESNPPEPLSARPGRFHSRTPSATSTASQVNHYDGRFRQDSHHSIAGKKSMKFAHHSNGIHGEGGENGHSGGTFGSGRGTGNGSHHHHIGRHGRGATGHASLFDNESPFPNATKTSRSTPNSATRISPRPATPRSSHVLRVPGGSKSAIPISYDLEGEGADDERTPLMGSVRSGRNRNSRRPPLRQDDYGKAHVFWRRFTGCILLGGLVGFLVAAIVIILVVCSKPLVDVRIQEILNVLASEQELMFDLHVHAINPNLVAIQVSDVSLEVFARKKHVGKDEIWRDGKRMIETDGQTLDLQPLTHPSTADYNSPNASNDANKRGGVDEGNDPIDIPGGESPLQQLGTILEFDSPLIFDASPIRHQPMSSTGEVRLVNPGNKTQLGSDGWEKVLQYPFILRVRGVIHYSLPISSRVRSPSVDSNVTVKPEHSTEAFDDIPPTLIDHIYDVENSRSARMRKERRKTSVKLVA